MQALLYRSTTASSYVPVPDSQTHSHSVTVGQLRQGPQNPARSLSLSLPLSLSQATGAQSESVSHGHGHWSQGLDASGDSDSDYSGDRLGGWDGPRPPLKHLDVYDCPNVHVEVIHTPLGVTFARH